VRISGTLLFLFFFVSVILGSSGHVNHVGYSHFSGSDTLIGNTEAQIELGKQLFYDPVLSRDSTVSCSTCHKPELAFTDGLSKSVGIFDQEGTRNAPTLTNVGNRPYFLLDGVNPTLETQTLVPIQEHKEFDFHISLVVQRLQKNPVYVELAKKGFNSEINQYVYTKAIATFERTLISNDSPYDRYLNGDKSALSASQLRGRKLFFDELYCAKCHSGNDFTNDALTNNGLYEVYADSGRMRLTENEADRAIFKVPTLRNIEVTAPYMHDGSLTSLEEIIEHYMKGGNAHKNKGKEIVPFELNARKKEDLINFLKSLTDHTFISNVKYRLE
jgi:cytochrome c peroxidase